MKQLKKIALAAMSTLMLVPAVTFAQTTQGNPFLRAQTDIKDIGTTAGISSSKSPDQIIGTIINYLLGFLGIVLLLYFLYAGFLWMTAGGEKGPVEKAQGIIKNCIIGLIIIVSAYALSNFVLTALVNVTQGP